MTISRRQFLGALAAGAASAAAVGAVGAQGASQVTGAPVTTPEAPGATMGGEGYRPVRLPPKPDARPSMNAAERDQVERQLSCPCPCTLDVFTCRTSMPCGFSPAMHTDVVALVDGGYSADEIIAAFERTYGEQVLMAPKKEGFNWAAYVAPFAAIGTGGAVIAALVKRWQRKPGPVAGSPRLPMNATDDELARLEAAVRGNDE
jgi:cytochrome c-type biogenesis protein CcmH